MRLERHTFLSFLFLCRSEICDNDELLSFSSPERGRDPFVTNRIAASAYLGKKMNLYQLRSPHTRGLVAGTGRRDRSPGPIPIV